MFGIYYSFVSSADSPNCINDMGVWHKMHLVYVALVNPIFPLSVSSVRYQFCMNVDPSTQ